jgi:hypothetical protein
LEWTASAAATYKCVFTQERSKITERVPVRSSKNKAKTYGDRGFEAAAAKEWNKLPLDIKLAPSIASFKSKLKTNSFRIHFNLNCDNET